MSSVIIGDDVDSLLLAVGAVLVVDVLELFGEHVGLSFCGSEDEFSEPGDFLSVDNTGASLNVDGLHLLINELSLFANSGRLLLNIMMSLVVKLRDHPLSNLEDLVAVLETGKGGFTLLKSRVLLLDELLLLSNILLDVIKQKRNGLVLVLLDLGQLMDKSFDVFGRGDLDIMFLALVEKVSELSLRLLAGLDLPGESKISWSFILVEIKELTMTNVTKFIHHIPGIILWHLKRVKLHRFRSKKAKVRCIFL